MDTCLCVTCMSLTSLTGLTGDQAVVGYMYTCVCVCDSSDAVDGKDGICSEVLLVHLV